MAVKMRPSVRPFAAARSTGTADQSLPSAVSPAARHSMARIWSYVNVPFMPNLIVSHAVGNVLFRRPQDSTIIVGTPVGNIGEGRGGRERIRLSGGLPEEGHCLSPGDGASREEGSCPKEHIFLKKCLYFYSCFNNR